MRRNIEDIRIRDPFVLSVDGMYYMYGTTDLGVGIAAGNTFSVYTSRDLKSFEGPTVVFRGENTDRDCWAAEVHAYGGRYFMFASIVHGDKKRCSEIFVSDSPTGEFTYYADATPKESTCLDATLYVENGVPYSVYCHEWTEAGIGQICAVRLSTDLKTFAAKPRVLFDASAAPWVNVSKNNNGVLCAVTDGPCLFRRDARLIMLWSSFTRENKYALGYSFADSVEGAWRQCDKPIFSQNGGHAMIFKSFEDKVTIGLHCPNDPPTERAVFTEFDYNVLAL